MLSKNLYRKKSPLSDKRKKALISVALIAALFVIGYGVYTLGFGKKVQKQEIKIETGDRPLQQKITLYINADKGLSLRKDRASNSERLVVIPNGTKLEATEELDGWYKVSYNGQEGWIVKEYTTLDAPAVDTTSSWSTYQNPIGYSMKYPAGWKSKDYGADSVTKATSIVAFGDQDLPQTLQALNDAPIVVKVLDRTIEDVKKEYSGISGVTKIPVTFGTISTVQYSYTAAATGTQVNTIVVAKADGKVIVLTENGGYLDDLFKMGKSFTLG